MLDFTGRVVVVTGAAGNLGRAVVTSFMETGATVCALDHRQGRLAGIYPEVKDSLKFYEGVNSTDRAAMIALGERIITELGPVDVLVNTVGGFTMGEQVHEISAETWQQMINMNVVSFLNACAAFVPAMLAAGRGKVVSIGAGAALKGGAKMGAYAAAKSALLRLTESMAAELKTAHIQVNCVLPGTIDTPQNREAMPKANFDQWVKPEQIAQAILLLSSDAADAITGVALPVTGG